MRFIAWIACLGLLASAGPGACAGGTASSRQRESALERALASPERSEADRARDAERRPAQVLAFLGVEPGMRALDLIAAGGYYSEVLSLAVGPEGRVYAQNNAFVLQMRDGLNEKALTTRLAGGRLPNVVRLDRELDDLGLAPESLDVAITALNFHDVYNRFGESAAREVLEAVRDALVTGGVFGVIDHVGEAGAHNEELHRIDPARIEAVAQAAGFVVESRSDLLRNPADDHRQSVFAPALRGRSDRILLRLRKH